MSDHVMAGGMAAGAAGTSIRPITNADVADALKRGLQDFMAWPSHAMFIVIIYPIIGLVIGAVTAHDDLMPLFFPLVTGFALLGPFAAIGLYQVSKLREQGHEPTWREALGVLRSPAIGSIAELAGFLTVIFIAWLVAAMVIFRLTVGASASADFPGFLREILTTRAGWTLIVAGNAVGFLFAAAAFCLGAVSFPLLVDGKGGLRTAISASLRSVVVNPGPMALWGLTIAVLLALGTLPFFIGLAVVLPVLGHATWHMYRKLVA